MKTSLTSLAFLAFLASACTQKEQPAPPPPPPAAEAPAAPAPATAPSAPANPDDVTHVTFDPGLGVDLRAMTKLPNGVYIRDLKPGTGPAAGPGSRVAIHYVGKLPNGQQFDANVAPNQPFSFVVDAGQVVPGFDWGVKGMKAGGTRMVIIPPSLGYGAGGNGPVPPNAVMTFQLQLVSTSGGR